ncbi:hypothetical protein B0H10DRAFT_1962583 [Mycena sp. CBHHK59/15]|nr:hypothetical protein B0H10DRAFT_1962583 [Mycena sp. CBHHK59/15]
MMLGRNAEVNTVLANTAEVIARDDLGRLPFCPLFRGCLAFLNRVQRVAQANSQAEHLITTEFQLSSFSTVWGRFLDLISARFKARHNTREAARLKACDNVDMRLWISSLNSCAAESTKEPCSSAVPAVYPFIIAPQTVKNMTGPRGTIANIVDLTHRFGSWSCMTSTARPSNRIHACKPGAPFVAVFDYTAGSAVEIHIEDAEQDVSKYFHGEHLEQWSDHVSRAGRSGGRMGFFAVAVPAGTQTRYFDILHRGETLDSYLGADHQDCKLSRDSNKP